MFVILLGKKSGIQLFGFFFSETSILKMLAPETKIAGLITQALARNCTPKLHNLDL